MCQVISKSIKNKNGKEFKYECMEKCEDPNCSTKKSSPNINSTLFSCRLKSSPPRRSSSGSYSSPSIPHHYRKTSSVNLSDVKEGQVFAL